MMTHHRDKKKTSRHRKIIPVETKGPLTVTDVGTMLGARLNGAGIAQVMAQDIVLNLFHEGEVFGNGRLRTADATAMSDCELVVIERRDFVPFLGSHPDVMLGYAGPASRCKTSHF